MAIFKNVLMSIALVTLAAGSASASPVNDRTAAPKNALLPRDGCFSGGESYDDAGFPDTFTTWVTNSCEILAQTYSPSETNSLCVTGQIAANRVNIDIENTSDSDASLTAADCETALNTERGACSTGSEQTYGSFHYVIDPNAGSC